MDEKGMSTTTYKLQLVDTQIKSKAKRIYKIFKPSEVIAGEPFYINLSFHNVGPKYPGGNILLKLLYGPPPHVIATETLNLGEMEPGSDLVLTTNWTTEDSGVGKLAIEEVSSANGAQVECVDKNGTNMIYRFDRAIIPFEIASKEEIYQKYSLVVALVALAISLVALIFALADLWVRLTQ
ncbi:MAG: hypothetical protein OEZ48_02705 [Candidatus Bathyarchaeota archaeon]|nr:hypothetical protein [Candidatus Bathyarchaeota archaeon]MDH5686763.1 hypothetical protein [Candidatus Bathyarchaeota archaeon]